MNRKVVVGVSTLGVIVCGAAASLRYEQVRTGGDQSPDRAITSDDTIITGPFSSGFRVVYESPADLIASAELVASAVFLGESDVEVPIPSPVDGIAYASRTDVVRQFRVIEVLKGEAGIAGEEIGAFVTTSNSFPMPNGELATVAAEHPTLKPGAVYVVFVKRTTSALARSPWSFFGEPEIASLDEDALRFLITPGYRQELIDQGRAVDGNALGGEFRLKLEELRHLVPR